MPVLKITPPPASHAARAAMRGGHDGEEVGA
jgi:hypothetical protein